MKQAFVFYRSVFGGDFSTPVHRFEEVPTALNQPAFADAAKLDEGGRFP